MPGAGICIKKDNKDSLVQVVLYYQVSEEA